LQNEIRSEWGVGLKAAAIGQFLKVKVEEAAQ